jgi:hypothetical protein
VVVLAASALPVKSNLVNASTSSGFVDFASFLGALRLGNVV